MSISEEQKETLIPTVAHSRKQSARLLDAEGRNTIVELVKSVNPYCVFAIKRNQVKTENSRKKMAPFFNGKLKCTFHTCPVTAAVKIWDETRNSVEILFEGQITHSSNEVFGLKRPHGTKTKQNRRGIKRPKLEVQYRCLTILSFPGPCCSKGHNYIIIRFLYGLVILIQLIM